MRRRSKGIGGGGNRGLRSQSMITIAKKSKSKWFVKKKIKKKKKKKKPPALSRFNRNSYFFFFTSGASQVGFHLQNGTATELRGFI